MAEPTGVQQLPVPASPLPAIFDLSKYVGGQKNTGQGSGTTNTQGQTAPLEALLATISDPNNLAALVGQLFNTGAAQVPGLTSQFANATGTRATNNTMLGQSLSMLNTNIMQQIAQAVQQQQATAVQGAGKLAETNKSTQSTENKSSVAKPNSMKNAAGTTAGSILAGTLLNQLGKGIFNPFDPKDKAKDKATTSTTPDTTNVATPDVTQGIQPNFDIGVGAATMPPAVVDTGAGSLDPVAIAGLGNGFDISGDADASATDATAVSAADNTVSSGAEDVSDFSDFDIGNAFDFGFADGGLVIRIPMPGTKSTANRVAMPMADGGTVMRRNVPNMGVSTGAAGTPAIAMPSLPSAPSGANGPLNLMQLLTALSNNKTNPADATSVATGGDAGAATDAGPDAGPAPSGLGLALGVAAPVAAAVGLGPIAAGLAMAGQALGLNGLIDSLTDALAGLDTTETNGESNAASLTSQTNSDSLAPGNDATGPTGLGGLMGDTGFGDDDGGAGTSPGDDGGGDAGSSDGDGGAGDGGGTGGGDGGGSGDGGGGEADGGTIKATTKKAKFGIDQQPIMATPGEFMLPLDTVNFIGQDVLDDLVSLTHIPLRGGR